LGAQVCFSTTQQLFSSPSSPKQQLVAFRKILFFQNQTQFPSKKRDVTHIEKTQKFRNSASSLIGGLLDIHIVMCSNLAEVHAK